MPDIHPTAIIDAGAEIADSAEIGPFCIIGPDVRIGERVRLMAYNYITGRTVIGDDCVCFPNVTLGTTGQILGAADIPFILEIGPRTIFRENVMISGAAPEKAQPTKIGSDCFFMVNTHIGHDCQIGNKCVFAPGVMVGGASHIGNQVWMGGAVAIHQNSWVGDHAFIGAGSMVTGDVVPFVSTQGNHASIAAINAVGLKRRGFSKADIRDIYGVVKAVFQSEGAFADRVSEAESIFAHSGPAKELLEFVNSKRSGRPLCHFRATK